MSHSGSSLPGVEDFAPSNEQSALFAALVMNLVNLAWLSLGRLPNPETGKVEPDLEHARLFIDQLEMLAGKTKGNLSAEEDRLLQEALMSVRLAFVESVEQAGDTARNSQAATTMPESGATPVDSEPAKVVTPLVAEEDARKKYVKKY